MLATVKDYNNGSKVVCTNLNPNRSLILFYTLMIYQYLTFHYLSSSLHLFLNFRLLKVFFFILSFRLIYKRSKCLTPFQILLGFPQPTEIIALDNKEDTVTVTFMSFRIINFLYLCPQFCSDHNFVFSFLMWLF